MAEKCYICEKGNLIKKKIEFKLYDVSLGKFDAEVCNKCGESFFDEKASDKIDAIAKAKGLWGLEADTTIGKTGDSLMVRINKKMAKFLNLHKGEHVTIRPETKNKLVIEI